jgi:hypothetical protein
LEKLVTAKSGAIGMKMAYEARRKYDGYLRD